MSSRKKSRTLNECSTTDRCVSDDAENSPISRLTDDSLRYVFSFLSVRDRIRIQRVCKRWQALGLLPWHDFKKLKVSYRLFNKHNVRHEEKIENPLKALKQVLTLCGPCVTTVQANGSFFSFINITDLLQLLKKMCPNVRHFDTRYPTLTRKAVELLASDYTNLTEIRIGECWVGCEETFAKFFSESKRLQSVEFRGCTTLTGACLLNLNPESVQKLLINDTKFSMDDLIKALQHFKKLRTFSLDQHFLAQPSKWMYKVDEILQQFSVKSNLEEIRLGNCTQKLILIPNIANFVNLKKLVLLGASFVNNKNLAILAQYCKSLRHVTFIDSSCVTDKGWELFVKELNLEELHVSRLNKITDKSFSYVPETLVNLNCHMCVKLSHQSFSSIVRTAKNLKHLEISYCKEVNVDTLIRDAVDAKKLLTDHRLELSIDRRNAKVRRIIDISPQLRIIENPRLYY